MREADPEYFIPLSPVEYQIMLALAGRPLYGFAIIEECQTDSEQVFSIRPSTMYPALRRLNTNGLIGVIGEDVQQGSRWPRRIYALTPAGRRILQQETGRLRRAVYLAEHRL